MHFIKGVALDWRDMCIKMGKPTDIFKKQGIVQYMHTWFTYTYTHMYMHVYECAGITVE